ncbi:hypothetical protein [Pseudoalteromonas sp. T1lg48]|uniref:hypothetical protein n=1 Tax=Pseudoalteromonas sp. T1lg48 TaxID=2077100 RepID=UPI001319F132|nr:hypothetical protein [Pseudoalteromonas sp. T1lg48]
MDHSGSDMGRRWARNTGEQGVAKFAARHVLMAGDYAIIAGQDSICHQLIINPSCLHPI